MELLIGAAVSLVVQWLKQKATSQWQTLGILLILSIATAGLYCTLVAVGYWETIANILMVAGAFYAFVVQRFESKNEAQQ